MTVTYRPKELLVFSHLKGTVLPEVWRMCAFTCALAYALCHVYNPIRQTVRDGGKKTFVRAPALQRPARPTHIHRPGEELSYSSTNHPYVSLHCIFPHLP